MDRLSQTVRIVSAALQKGQHNAEDIPNLLQSVHASLPRETKQADAPSAPAPDDPTDSDYEHHYQEVEDGANRGPVMGFTEALAASRARFAGTDDGMSQEDRVASAAAGTEAARAAVMGDHEPADA